MKLRTCIDVDLTRCRTQGGQTLASLILELLHAGKNKTNLLVNVYNNNNNANYTRIKTIITTSKFNISEINGQILNRNSGVAGFDHRKYLLSLYITGYKVYKN